jgi:hypothetical protein
MKTNEKVYIGELIGYTSRLNFFSQNVSAIVKIEGKTRKIPFDNKQIEFVQKEYPAGSKVNVGYNGKWYIISQSNLDDFKPHNEEIPFYDK